MKYARLYRVRGQWELTIGLDFECRQVLSVQTLPNKRLARAAALLAGAKAVNF